MLPQIPGFEYQAVLAKFFGYKYLVVLGYIVFNMVSSKANESMWKFEKSLNWQQQQSQVQEKSSKGKNFRSSQLTLDNNDVLLRLASVF